MRDKVLLGNSVPKVKIKPQLFKDLNKGERIVHMDGTLCVDGSEPAGCEETLASYSYCRVLDRQKKDKSY